MVRRINTHKIKADQLAQVAQLITSNCKVAEEAPDVCVGTFLDTSGCLCSVHLVVRPVENRLFIQLDPDINCIEKH